MNADQVIEGIAKAVAAVKPAQEYCLLWSDWSSVCWPLPDWLGVLGLIVSLIAAAGTIGAVLVALNLARKNDSHRDVSDARMMRIHALFLLPVLRGFHTDLRNAAAYAYFADFDKDNPHTVRELLVRAQKWAADFEGNSALEALSAASLHLLPETPALRISHALGILQSIRIEISRFDQNHYSDRTGTILSVTKRWALERSQASDFIAAALFSLENVAELKEIVPSLPEIHGDLDAD